MGDLHQLDRPIRVVRTQNDAARRHRDVANGAARFRPARHKYWARRDGRDAASCSGGRAATPLPAARRGDMARALSASALTSTKRSHSPRSPMVSGLRRCRKRLRNFSESRAWRGGMRGVKAASCSDTRGTLSNDDARSGRCKARSRSSSGSARSRTSTLQDVEQAVHGFGAEAATGVEEIRHVGLLKTGVARESRSGQFPTVDAGPDMGAQVVFEVGDSHSIAKSYTCTFVICL